MSLRGNFVWILGVAQGANGRILRSRRDIARAAFLAATFIAATVLTHTAAALPGADTDSALLVQENRSMFPSRMVSWVVALAGIASLSAMGVILTAAEPAQADLRAAAKKLQQEGNFKDAYEAYRKLTLDPKSDAGEVGNDLKQAIVCLQRLGRSDEVDEYRDEVIATHSKNWRLLQSAAETFIEGEPYGYIVAGKFYRGNKRGGGEWVQSADRDRVRALQLMQQAMTLVAEEKDKQAAGRFYLKFAYEMLYVRGYLDAWRLQVLTDLTTLPDYDRAGYGYGRRGRYGVSSQNGAPVDADGNPVFYSVPESWEASKSDGERWRWLLEQGKKTDPGLKNEADVTFANFLDQQFGVQTMAQYGWFLGVQTDQEDKDESGPYAVHTLKEDETIARLATGAKRFKLPDEFNYIRIYREVADSGKSQWGGAVAECPRPDLREPPAVSEGGRGMEKGDCRLRSGSEQLASATARPDRRQLGALRKRLEPAGRGRGDG